MSDEKERFKTIVKELAAHLMKTCPPRPKIQMSASEIESLVQRAILAGVQLAKPPNALLLAGALRGCTDYLEAITKHGCVDWEKARATGVLPADVMLPRWRAPLEGSFQKTDLTRLYEESASAEPVEESHLPADRAPPKQAPDK